MLQEKRTTFVIGESYRTAKHNKINIHQLMLFKIESAINWLLQVYITHSFAI